MQQAIDAALRPRPGRSAHPRRPLRRVLVTRAFVRDELDALPDAPRRDDGARPPSAADHLGLPGTRPLGAAAHHRRRRPRRARPAPSTTRRPRRMGMPLFDRLRRDDRGGRPRADRRSRRRARTGCVAGLRRHRGDSGGQGMVHAHVAPRRPRRDPRRLGRSGAVAARLARRGSPSGGCDRWSGGAARCWARPARRCPAGAGRVRGAAVAAGAGRHQPRDGRPQAGRRRPVHQGDRRRALPLPQDRRAPPDQPLRPHRRCGTGTAPRPSVGASRHPRPNWGSRPR